MKSTPCDIADENRKHHCPYADDNDYVSCRDMCGLGVDEDEYEDDFDDYDEDYCPSSTNGDYSPSNPWDAPGMSISDFI